LLATYGSMRGPDGKFATIAGDVPGAGEWGRGCRFVARCPLAVARCHEARPSLDEVSPAHLVRCLLSGSREEPGA